MTKQKKNENKLNLFFLLLLFSVFLVSTVNSNEAICKNLDFKCKTKKFIAETKEFQKKGFEENKKQINNTKNKILKVLPKKK